MRRRYYVLTWDAEEQDWTPQQGVRTGPYSLWGLRRALRKLQAMGYSCDYSSRHGSGDPFVLVYSPEAQAALFDRASKAVQQKS